MSYSNNKMMMMMMINTEEQSGSFGPSRSPSGRRLAKRREFDNYLACVLFVLLHACFSVIPFLLATIFGGGHPYIFPIYNRKPVVLLVWALPN